MYKSLESPLNSAQFSFLLVDILRVCTYCSLHLCFRWGKEPILNFNFMHFVIKTHNLFPLLFNENFKDNTVKQ